MNYNTFSFWLFFLALYAVYGRLSHRGQNRLMLAASYLFYGFWDYRFLFLIHISTLIDFVGGLGVAGVHVGKRRFRGMGLLLVASALALCSHIPYGTIAGAVARGDLAGALSRLPSRPSDYAVPAGTLVAVLAYGALLPHLYALPEARRRKAFLVISMVANLAILGFFKYFDFFTESLAALLRLFGVDTSVRALGVVLPAGISFYTFQAMSYTIDIYRGDAEPTDDLADFALFVCFFPHLVAGPIMRAHTLLPQVANPRRHRPEATREGIILIGIGLFKKVVIADNMAAIANAVFFRFADGTDKGMTGVEALVGLYAFALQIYGDFSGYSAVARGISKLLDYELALNFDLPYLAQSPSDFWKRWHISLSSWLRDYLYIPLGGNRRGTVAMYRNLILTMLLGGLWHGARWTFVAWGLYHGLLLVVFRVLRIPETVEGRGAAATVRRGLRIALMFHLTCLGWLLFRAETFGAALAMARLIVTDFRVTSWVVTTLVMMAFLSAPLLLSEPLLAGERRLDRLARAPALLRGLAYACAVAMVLFFHAEHAVDFIYFQF